MSAAKRSQTPSSRPILLAGIFIVGLTLTALGRVLVNGFINYDDLPYVLANEHVKSGLTLRSIAWAFRAFHSGNWHPLTWISHMLDVEIYGLRPWGHHATSLVLHTANTLLLFLLLVRMTGCLWKSVLVAGLFGVHPLRLESVAWVAERKDVLSAFFWFLTMHAYLRYVVSPSVSRYVLVVLAFGLGLMAKPMLVTLPFVLLLLDYWPLCRVRRSGFKCWATSRTASHGNIRMRATENSSGAAGLRTFSSWSVLVLEKLPLLFLVLVSCIITFKAQRYSGAVLASEIYPVGVRIANGLVSYVAYFLKIVWPRNLAVFYPHPGASLPEWLVVVSAMAVVAVSLAVLLERRDQPHLAVGWFWYLGTLVPVIGFVQVGSQAMADRYTYIPMIGLSIAIAWSIPHSWFTGSMRQVFVFKTIALIVLVAFALCSFVQVGYWHDSIVLFGRAIAATSANHLAHHNLAVALRREKKLDEAAKHYLAVLRIKPNEVGVHAELAGTYFEMGRLDDALAEYLELVKARPGDADVRCGLGELYLMRGEKTEALQQFKQALRIAPDNRVARFHLQRLNLSKSEDVKSRMASAGLLVHQGRYKEAVEEYKEILFLQPDYAQAHADLGAVLTIVGRTDEAIREYRKALSLAPSDARVHSNLAVALYSIGDYRGAWREVRLCRKYGGKPPDDFIRALSEKMPPP